MINLHRHIQIAIGYFFIVALIGVLMRFYVVYPLPIVHKYILHAHSHVAILGWIYLGLSTLIYHVFLKEANKPKRYRFIFGFTNLTILGMLVTFPIQGYALFSIIFSTLFLFASYWFTGFAIKNVSEKFENRFSWKLIKMALFYLVISSIGPWAIGGVMATLGTETVWYKTSIYFYLHFQYNGWFVMALLGILFYILEEKGIAFDSTKLKSFSWLLNTGILLSFFLSTLWFKPHGIIYIMGWIGATAQLMGFVEIFHLLFPKIVEIKRIFSSKLRLMLKIAAALMILKLVMQLMAAIPYYASLVYVLKDFIIGYLHLVFLGIIIPLMLVFLYYFKLINLSKKFIYAFIFTVAATEIIIFYKAMALWLGWPFFENYYLILALVSSLFLIVIGQLLIENLRTSPNSKTSEISR